MRTAGRNLGCRWKREQNIPVAALTEGADLNLSAFLDKKNAACYSNRAAVGFHAFSRGIKGVSFRAPSPGKECGPEPVRFFVETGSGMMANGASATERTSIVPCATKRHGLCQ
jgi:hypothetical protein